MLPTFIDQMLPVVAAPAPSPWLDPLTIARWQFTITTIYHFVLVPITIGMSLVLAIAQTLWTRTQDVFWWQIIRFFGPIFVLTFAVGVATGLVQEFQFGMNWSEYSRFVGDVFGAPLALESLFAFFAESALLGLWVFGWGTLSPKAHNATIWGLTFAAHLSTCFIIGANSWMQHPVGAVFDPVTGRAALDGWNGFFAIVTNWTLWTAVLHVCMSSWIVSGTLMGAIAWWWMVKTSRKAIAGGTNSEDAAAESLYFWRPLVRISAGIVIVSSVLTFFTGHLQGVQIATEQPMKLAVGEAYCEPKEGGAPLVLFAYGTSCKDAKTFGEIPGLLSFLATGSPSGKVASAAEVQKHYYDFFLKTGGERGRIVSYEPPFMLTFWSYRLMVLFQLILPVLAIAALWLTRRGRTYGRLGSAAVVIAPIPTLAGICGWVYTEVGRQPWAVYPNFDKGVTDLYMLTSAGLSQIGTTGAQLAFSLAIFTVLYLVLAIAWLKLSLRRIRAGLGETIGGDDYEESASSGPGADPSGILEAHLGTDPDFRELSFQ
ncbi:MAG: cytochrome ubiquinol oxidase subunit I [Actinomycetaceae bacterium]|nr:cytochrome ubiquinol oxidase subunit I [Actinomycetaceae bacterium]